jgi:hypothetical protein
MLRVWPQPQHRACSATGQNLEDAGAIASYHGLPAAHGVLAAPLQIVLTAKLIDAQIAAAPRTSEASCRGAMPRLGAGPSISDNHQRSQRVGRGPRQGGAPVYMSAGGISKGE